MFNSVQFHRQGRGGQAHLYILLSSFPATQRILAEVVKENYTAPLDIAAPEFRVCTVESGYRHPDLEDPPLRVRLRNVRLHPISIST